MSTRRKFIKRDPQGRELSTEEEKEDGVLKDGQSLRVPMWAMDSVQRAVGKEAPTSKLLVDDGTGNSLNLHKPGFRYSTNAAERAAADVALTEAYEARELADREDYRSHDDHPLNQNTRGLSPSRKEGDRCSIDGQRGRLQLVNGALQCLPDHSNAQTVTDERALAYAEYDREAENAWR
jgi:hypothetical protein